MSVLGEECSQQRGQGLGVGGCWVWLKQERSGVGQVGVALAFTPSEKGKKQRLWAD